jgi:hypothetical protein
MPTTEELQALWEGIEMIRAIAQSRRTTLDICLRNNVWRLTLGGLHHVEADDLMSAVLGARIRWKQFHEKHPRGTIDVRGHLFEPINETKFMCRDLAIILERKASGHQYVWTARRGIAYIYSQKHDRGGLRPRMFRSIREAAERALDTWAT